MSYTLSNAPSTRDSIVQIADFFEIECLKKADRSISILDIAKMLGITDDIQEDEDEEEDFKLEGKLQEVTDEIGRRVKSCKGKYPFKLNDHGYVITIDDKVKKDYLWIYTYLLLATRNNMRDNKLVGNIDGTRIFERLSKDVLLNYLGKHSNGIVFGTASQGSFYKKIEKLILNIDEGKLHQKNGVISYNPQDDKLDIAAWISFNDGLPSKLICFAQCKTGTHWEDAINQLDVSNFLKKWFSLHPRVDPVRTFIIADILHASDFYHKSGNNLFLDRCRLTSFSILNNDNDWFRDLQKWTKGIMKQFNLSF